MSMMMYDEDRKRKFAKLIGMPPQRDMEMGDDMAEDALGSALHAFKRSLGENDMATAKRAFRTAVSMCSHEQTEEYEDS